MGHGVMDRSMHDGSLPDPRPVMSDLGAISWYVRCLNDVIARKRVRGLDEAECGYMAAMERLSAVPDTTTSSILDAFARKLTELDARSVRLGGQALSLGDPRDIAGQIHTLARTLEHFASWGEDGTLTAEALGAQCVAFLLARARVDELRVDAGDAA